MTPPSNSLQNRHALFDGGVSDVLENVRDPIANFLHFGTEWSRRGCERDDASPFMGGKGSKGMEFLLGTCGTVESFPHRCR